MVWSHCAWLFSESLYQCASFKILSSRFKALFLVSFHQPHEKHFVLDKNRKEETGLWAGSPRPGVQTCFFFNLPHDLGRIAYLDGISSASPGCLCGPASNCFPPDTWNGLPPPGLSALTSPPPPTLQPSTRPLLSSKVMVGFHFIHFNLSETQLLIERGFTTGGYNGIIVKV